jgi:hypothetical protein
VGEVGGSIRYATPMPYANLEEQRAYQRAWIASRREAWITEHGPCIDCRSYYNLQVDHADASTKISHRVWSWSAARRAEELAKCVVRCETCHLKKSATEKAKGEAHGFTTLTDAQVLAIFASPESCRVLGARYGIHYTNISRIKRGVSWAHLTQGGVAELAQAPAS